MQGSPPHTSILVSIPGNASPRSRTTHCKTWAFSARLRFESRVSTSLSVLMKRHTLGSSSEANISRPNLHHRERILGLQPTSQRRAVGENSPGASRNQIPPGQTVATPALDLE